MNLTIYQVDAFASEVFKGNPAAVCPLDEWLDAELMQRIALENNLSETAFFVKKDDVYEIRWFTPTFEIDLCGHATLASAFVIFECLKAEESLVKFHSPKSGALEVEKNGDRLILDFPSRPVQQTKMPDGLIEAIGKEPKEVFKARDYFLVYETAQEILDHCAEFFAAFGSWRTRLYRDGERRRLRFRVEIFCSRSRCFRRSCDGFGALQSDSVLGGKIG